MPARTNREQKLVFLIKQHLAAEGVTVAESRMMRSSLTGRRREVDVTVDAVVNGEALTIAFEVRGTRRPLDASAVDGVFGKFDHLPINKCVLVSWSGFTAEALALVAARPGRYVALQPVIENEEPAVGRFYVDQFHARVNLLKTAVRLASGEHSVVCSKPGDQITVFNSDGEGVAYVEQVAHSLCFGEDGRGEVAKALQNIANKDEIGGFEFVWPMPACQLSLRWEDTKELRPIVGLGVYGAMKVWRSEVALRSLVLGDQRVAVGDARMFGADAVWVASMVDERQMAIRWQIVDPTTIDPFVTGGYSSDSVTETDGVVVNRT